MTSVLAVDGSPQGGGRTELALRAVLAGAEGCGADVSVVSLAGGEEAIAAAVAELGRHEAFVLGAPAYRAAPAAPLKALLDATPRGFWGEQEAPITARAVGLVMTGSTHHHYLALDGLRSVLAGFFAAHVLSPGLYLASDSFVDGPALSPKAAAAAAAQGRALVALARAVASSPDLAAVVPQA
ncbi:NAD(P)H-dependent oxidoreductase [uncultured Friedmanniella sp.]|uniref:NAD(P)H-dependent oxidoreductase n=1 Tax=uncultured Friedmanniella sp. TaxID=335381 RepID=UPI0035CC28C6